MTMVYKIQRVLMLTHINNLREKFSSGPGFEPGSPALHAGTLTNWATQTIHWAKLEFFSY